MNKNELIGAMADKTGSSKSRSQPRCYVVEGHHFRSAEKWRFHIPDRFWNLQSARAGRAQRPQSQNR